ncbi:MAG: dihydropteroate synthase [Thermosulfidibacteraceae bacterium]
MKEELIRRIRDLNERPLVMGILNVTDDSFYSLSRAVTFDSAISSIERMVECGVDIVDIGGESTRPGADPISVDEELRRVIPIVEEVKKRYPELPISVDTYKSEVAKRSLEVGVEIINDVSAFRFDEKLYDVIVTYKPIYVLMHMKGTPKDMQVNPHYDDVVEEVKSFLMERAKILLDAGFPVENVVVDPGIGFGKRLMDNLLLIRAIPEFGKIAPVLIGPSRKSFIGAILDGLPPEERLEGTLAVVAVSVFLGARIVRVHDVKEALRAVKVSWALVKGNA